MPVIFLDRRDPRDEHLAQAHTDRVSLLFNYLSANCPGVHDRMANKTTITRKQTQGPAVVLGMGSANQARMQLLGTPNPVCPVCYEEFRETIELAVHFVRNHRSDGI